MKLLPMVLQRTLPHVSLTSDVSMAMGFDYIKCLDSNITGNFSQQPLHDRGQMLVGSGTFQNNPKSHIFLLAAHCRLHPSHVPGVEPRLPFEPHVCGSHGSWHHPASLPLETFKVSTGLAPPAHSPEQRTMGGSPMWEERVPSLTHGMLCHLLPWPHSTCPSRSKAKAS